MPEKLAVLIYHNRECTQLLACIARPLKLLLCLPQNSYQEQEAQA